MSCCWPRPSRSIRRSFAAMAAAPRAAHDRHRRRQHQAGRDRRRARERSASRCRGSFPRHPIAGTEQSGAAAAFATLLREPQRRADAAARKRIRSPLATVAAAWQTCGARGAHARCRRARPRLRRGVAPAASARVCARRRACPRVPTRTSSSASRPAAFATSRGSPQARRRCGAISRSPTATRSLAEVDAYRAQLDRIAALVDRRRRRRPRSRCSPRARDARRAWDARRNATGGPRARRRSARGVMKRRDASPALDLPPVAHAAGTRRAARARRASRIARCCSRRSRQRHDARCAGCSTPTTSIGCCDALATLGMRVDAGPRRASSVVHGTGRRHSRAVTRRLFLGNAGTAFRPLTAVLAFARGHYELAGVARMHERPDRRSGRRAARARRRHPLSGQRPDIRRWRSVRGAAPGAPQSRARQRARRRLEPVRCPRC